MSDVLLLNSDYNPISVLPLSVIGWQHAVKLYFLDRITVVEEYEDWVIRSENFSMNVPCVAVTKEYFHFKKSAKFSRSNMFLRDMYQCQYCSEVFEHKELTLDHVIPRAQGGKTTWENSVTACKDCNHKKGHKREIHLGPQARAIIARRSAGLSPDDRLFKLRADSYTTTIDRACKRAGVPHWHPHQLRHLAGSMVRDKYGLDAAQAFLGHATAKTSEIYAKVKTDLSRQAAEEIG